MINTVFALEGSPHVYLITKTHIHYPHIHIISCDGSYGFAYHLYLDGTIEGNVKLTGALSTGALSVGKAELRCAFLLSCLTTSTRIDKISLMVLYFMAHKLSSLAAPS